MNPACRWNRDAGGRREQGRGHLLDAEVVLLEEEAARTRTVPAAFDLGHAAQVTGAENVLLECTPPDSLDVLGAHQLPLLRLHPAPRTCLVGGGVPVEFPRLSEKRLGVDVCDPNTSHEGHR